MKSTETTTWPLSSGGFAIPESTTATPMPAPVYPRLSLQDARPDLVGPDRRRHLARHPHHRHVAGEVIDVGVLTERVELPAGDLSTAPLRSVFSTFAPYRVASVCNSWAVAVDDDARDARISLRDALREISREPRACEVRRRRIRPAPAPPPRSRA